MTSAATESFFLSFELENLCAPYDGQPEVDVAGQLAHICIPLSGERVKRRLTNRRLAQSLNVHYWPTQNLYRRFKDSGERRVQGLDRRASCLSRLYRHDRGSRRFRPRLRSRCF